MPGSDLTQVNGYPASPPLPWLPPGSLGKCRDVTSIRPQQLPSKQFPIHPASLSYLQTLSSLRYEEHRKISHPKKHYNNIYREGSKGKDKMQPRIGHAVPERKQRYSSIIQISSIHCIGRWVDPTARLDGCGESRPPTGIGSLYHPVRSKSLCQLHYPGPQRDGSSFAKSTFVPIRSP